MKAGLKPPKIYTGICDHVHLRRIIGDGQQPDAERRARKLHARRSERTSRSDACHRVRNAQPQDGHAIGRATRQWLDRQQDARRRLGNSTRAALSIGGRHDHRSPCDGRLSLCISTPKMPATPAIPERQALKLPDGGSTTGRVDDEIRRRRAMMATAYTGAIGLGSGPSTTSTLGT